LCLAIFSKWAKETERSRKPVTLKGAELRDGGGGEKRENRRRAPRRDGGHLSDDRVELRTEPWKSLGIKNLENWKSQKREKNSVEDGSRRETWGDYRSRLAKIKPFLENRQHTRKQKRRRILSASLFCRLPVTGKDQGREHREGKGRSKKLSGTENYGGVQTPGRLKCSRSGNQTAGAKKEFDTKLPYHSYGTFTAEQQVRVIKGIKRDPDVAYYFKRQISGREKGRVSVRQRKRAKP